MRYYTALIPLLGSLVASASIAPEEESTNNYVLPNAFMVHEVLGRVYMGRYGWRGSNLWEKGRDIQPWLTMPSAVKYVDLVAPRMGTCVSDNEECSALGVHPNPRRRYFMEIENVPASVQEGEVTFEVKLTSSSISGDSYSGTGNVTVKCNEDECTSSDRFFLPIGNVPYTTYLNGDQ